MHSKYFFFDYYYYYYYYYYLQDILSYACRIYV